MDSNSKVWLVFVVLAGLCWGVYVPLIAQGGKELKSSYAGFLCVGVAYFLIAILFPLAMFWIRGSFPKFTAPGATFATLAEGSIPRWRIPAFAKFCNMMPSLLPISTTNGSDDCKYLRLTKSPNSLKCTAMRADVDEKNAYSSWNIFSRSTCSVNCVILQTGQNPTFNSKKYSDRN